MSDADDISVFQNLTDFLRLFYHESCRVFQDRLVNNQDRQWFEDLLKEKMETDFNMQFTDVVSRKPVLYGDFMQAAAVDNRPYLEIPDHDKVRLPFLPGNSRFVSRLKEKS